MLLLDFSSLKLKTELRSEAHEKVVNFLKQPFSAFAEKCIFADFYIIPFLVNCSNTKMQTKPICVDYNKCVKQK